MGLLSMCGGATQQQRGRALSGGERAVIYGAAAHNEELSFSKCQEHHLRLIKSQYLQFLTNQHMQVFLGQKLAVIPCVPQAVAEKLQVGL